jgi:hypothetical protein
LFVLKLSKSSTYPSTMVVFISDVLMVSNLIKRAE